MSDDVPDREDKILDVSKRLGVAFMTNGALIALLADRGQGEPAVVEAAMRELECRNRRRD
jgi:hypothetical protein